jgi:hypothetical protein
LAHLSDQLLVLCERKYTQQQLESKSYNIIYLTNQVAFLLFKKLFMQSSKYYDTVFQLKKEFTKSNLVLYLSFILVTWSLLQVSLTDFFENNDNILMKVSSIYAQDDGGGNDNDEVSDDNGDSDVEELSQEEDSQDEDVGQEDFPREQTVEDSHDEGIDISRFSGSGPSGTDITSQLTPVDIFAF